MKRSGCRITSASRRLGWGQHGSATHSTTIACSLEMSRANLSFKENHGSKRSSWNKHHYYEDDEVLLMKPKGPHGGGTWSTPGGYLDFGETLEGCAAREAKEEMGIDVVDIRFRTITNDIFEETGKHYI